jgi:arylsulfatase A-like enzyme
MLSLKRATRAPATLLALAGVVAIGCGTDCTPSEGEFRPNVLLITVDTLRADHLECYGNSTVRTPHLCAMASEGVLFERAYSESPLTIPSHITILSSVPAARHGVRKNEGGLSRPVDVLPEFFRRAGYRTAAFVSAAHLGPTAALGQLVQPVVEEFQWPRRQSKTFRAEETNERVLSWLRGVCREPFFVWVHYFDPHMPYTPPSPFDTLYYKGDPYDVRHQSMAGVALNWYFYDLSDVRAQLKKLPEDMRALKRQLRLNSRGVRRLVLHPLELRHYIDEPDTYQRGRDRLRRMGAFVRMGLPLRRNIADWLTDVRDLKFPLAQYAGEVSYVDREIGRLRAELERLGIAERTITLITADHGESLGEHGLYFTHYGLHEPNLRVPLIIWWPGRIQPERRSELVSSLDIAPTILSLVGLSVPATMQGRDLLAPATDPTPIFAESGGGNQVMIRSGDWKLIRTVNSFYYVDGFEREQGATEVYHLSVDPGERTDLARKQPDVASSLEAHLDAWLAAQQPEPGGPAVPVAAETLESLRALGYVE